MRSWQEILTAADPLVRFLQQDAFYGEAYRGNSIENEVVLDVATARRFATDDSFDDFDEWESVSEGDSVFPDCFVWSRQIEHQLWRNEFWGIERKNFNGADFKWRNSVSCPLVELMIRDIGILFQCYANEYFPAVWEKILGAYLDGGFPCGWNGRYPDGKLVVFSNFQSD
ncbi:hypothetical protein [Burkholderia sp. F1]|uniref:hypothetical protein n=1 Tax=Burkholderia sp. F1 TaxID=3366817 RepID=UPI003D70F042